jgi:hypothetical protein
MVLMKTPWKVYLIVVIDASAPSHEKKLVHPIKLLNENKYTIPFIKR